MGCLFQSAPVISKGIGGTFAATASRTTTSRVFSSVGLSTSRVVHHALQSHASLQCSRMQLNRRPPHDLAHHHSFHFSLVLLPVFTTRKCRKLCCYQPLHFQTFFYRTPTHILPPIFPVTYPCSTLLSHRMIAAPSSLRPLITPDQSGRPRHVRFEHVAMYISRNIQEQHLSTISRSHRPLQRGTPPPLFASRLQSLIPHTPDADTFTIFVFIDYTANTVVLPSRCLSHFSPQSLHPLLFFVTLLPPRLSPSLAQPRKLALSLLLAPVLLLLQSLPSWRSSLPPSSRPILLYFTSPQMTSITLPMSSLRSHTRPQPMASKLLPTLSLRQSA